jgi:acetylglutamate kinase
MERTGWLAVKIVIKIGGAALDDKSTTAACVAAVAELSRDGHSVVIVHGGGAALTRTLKRMGKASEFVDGLRVTDAETRDVALMVLSGLANKSLVAALNQSGVSAIGISGGDGATMLATKKESSGRDLGFVGEISRVDPQWLDLISSAGAIPVLSSMALGETGEYFNVNADQVAAACAGAVRADVLVFLTDVAGVKQSDGSVIPWLNPRQVASLIANSVVTGGMLPKLAACQRAMELGVPRVRIMPAAQAGILPRLCVDNITCGTEMVNA